MDPCKEFVKSILLPYRDLQIKLLILSTDQEIIWLIESWSVHVNKEFQEWMKKHHYEIHVLANCTSIYQPAHVILKHSFKYAFQEEFNKYAIDIMAKQSNGRKISENGF